MLILQMGMIAETRNQTGLQVKCGLSTKSYPTKNKVSDDRMADLDLLKHSILPQWNYSTRFAKNWIDAKNSTYQFSRQLFRSTANGRQCTRMERLGNTVLELRSFF